MRAAFGDFMLDLDRRELSRDRESLHLSTKAFLLLEHLVRNAPRALTKQELYEHLWGETFVEEANLPNLISEIRATLGESRKAPHFVKTVHGYGYAFTGEVSVTEERRRLSDRIFSLRWGRDERPLKDGENVIGRDESADVVIDSASVSRRHARIVIARGAASIEDLGSKNGTFVRDDRISAAVPVADGDEIRVGHVTLTFRTAARKGTTVTGMQ